MWRRLLAMMTSVALIASVVVNMIYIHRLQSLKITASEHALRQAIAYLSTGMNMPIESSGANTVEQQDAQIFAAGSVLEGAQAVYDSVGIKHMSGISHMLTDFGQHMIAENTKTSQATYLNSVRIVYTSFLQAWNPGTGQPLNLVRLQKAVNNIYAKLPSNIRNQYWGG